MGKQITRSRQKYFTNDKKREKYYKTKENINKRSNYSKCHTIYTDSTIKSWVTQFCIFFTLLTSVIYRLSPDVCLKQSYRYFCFYTRVFLRIGCSAAVDSLLSSCVLPILELQIANSEFFRTNDAWFILKLVEDPKLVASAAQSSTAG